MRQINRWKLALARAKTRCSPKAVNAMRVLLDRAYKSPGKVFVGYGGRWRHCHHDQGRRLSCRDCGAGRPDDYKTGVADEMDGKGGRARSTAWRAMRELVRADCVVRWPGSDVGGRTATGRGHAAEYSPPGGEEKPPAADQVDPADQPDPPAQPAARRRLREAIEQLGRGSP